MKIDIIVDTICPWCYVGKKRFERALSMRPQPDLEVGWRAFQLNPRMPEDGMDRREYVTEKFGGLERANAIHGSLIQAGVEEGIEFDFSDRPHPEHRQFAPSRPLCGGIRCSDTGDHRCV